MTTNIQYRGILKHKGQELFSTEYNYPHKLIVLLICKLEDEFHYAKALVTEKSTGEIIYQAKRTAIC